MYIFFWIAGLLLHNGSCVSLVLNIFVIGQMYLRGCLYRYKYEKHWVESCTVRSEFANFI